MFMKKKVLLLTAACLFSLLVNACDSSAGGNDNPPTPIDPTPTPEPEPGPGPEPEPEPGTIKINAKILGGTFNPNKPYYDVTINYADTYFDKSSAIFNKDLATLLMACSFTSNDLDEYNSLLGQADYSLTYKSSDYEVEPTQDTLGYTFSKKSLENKDIILVCVRGINYKSEFANNMEIGESGNHVGFERSTNRVYNDLVSYINENEQNKDVSLILTGYSRGGCVANMLADKIMKNEDIKVEKNDLYTYTFMAPRAIHKSNVVAYPNVFNIVNSGELVTSIVPADYNLYRCGIDLDIYSKDADEIVKGFDDKITLHPFTSSSDYKNEEEIIRYVLKAVVDSTKVDETGKSEDEIKDEMRKNFCDYYQTAMMFMIRAFYTLKPETVEKIKNDILGGSKIFDLLSEDTTYTLLKGYLDEDGMEYDDAELRVVSKQLSNFVMKVGISLVGVLMSDSAKDSLLRTIDFHYPEITYSLFANYQYQA